MEYQELIERLRYERANDPEKMMRTIAANVIESLLAENERLKHNLSTTEQTMREYQELAAKRLEEIAKYRDAEMGGDSDSEQAGYWCVVCGRFLRADEFGVIVHDDKPHPESMTFEEPMQ